MASLVQKTVPRAKKQVSTNAEVSSIFRSLHQIKIGNDPTCSLKRKDQILFFRNLTTLVQNGVSLSQALQTICEDRGLQRYNDILARISLAVSSGQSFSSALRQFPAAFNATLISQIEVGEKSGAIDQSLVRITEQLERSSNQISYILKKLAYPAILLVAGIGSVTFMLLHVIPTFKTMYDDAGASLPAVTQLLIDVSQFLTDYWVTLAVVTAFFVVLTYFALQNDSSRLWIDRTLIRLPLVGDWFRSFAILQFADVLGNLMESGFTLAEALPPAGRAISNRFVRQRILRLYTAVRRGERFSESLDREGDLFPPVVSQLVIVGERTGRLVPITRQIRSHVRRDVESRTDALVATIEPTLTILLAAAVGGILLAVYLPMFDLIGKTN